MSAAASDMADSRVSATPFIRICHARLSTAMDSLPAKSKAAFASSGGAAASGASGATFARVMRWTNSATSISTCAGSAPSSYCCCRFWIAPATSPRIRRSNNSITRALSARPSMERTSSAGISRPGPPCAIAWSSSDRESRTEPSAAREISASASGSISTFSVAQMRPRCFINSAGSTRRRSKRRQRERTVTGTFSISVVAKTNFTCSGGSSSVLSSALNALFESMCTSSMM